MMPKTALRPSKFMRICFSGRTTDPVNRNRTMKVTSATIAEHERQVVDQAVLEVHVVSREAGDERVAGELPQVGDQILARPRQRSASTRSPRSH